MWKLITIRRVIYLKECLIRMEKYLWMHAMLDMYEEAICEIVSKVTKQFSEFMCGVAYT